jgi:hypothetical protein
MQWPRKPWAFEAAAVLAEVVLTARFHYARLMDAPVHGWEEYRAEFVWRVQEQLGKMRMRERILDGQFAFDNSLWKPECPEDSARIGLLMLAFSPVDHFRWYIDFEAPPEACLYFHDEKNTRQMNPFRVEWAKED